MSLSWSTALPATYSYTLMIDKTDLLPFAVTQNPLCGETLTITLETETPMLDKPLWANIVADSSVEISASDLALEGDYNLMLSAYEPIFGATSPYSLISITLVNPC